MLSFVEGLGGGISEEDVSYRNMSILGLTGFFRTGRTVLVWAFWSANVGFLIAESRWNGSNLSSLKISLVFGALWITAGPCGRTLTSALRVGVFEERFGRRLGELC